MENQEERRSGEGKRRGRPPKIRLRNRSNRQGIRMQGQRSRSRERQREQRLHEGSPSNNESNDSQLPDVNEYPCFDSSQEIQIPNQGASNQQYASSLRSSFITFLGQLKHSKGLVFTPQDRQKLMNQQLKKKKRNLAYNQIKWNKDSEWHQEKQKIKIDQTFQLFLGEISNEQKKELKEIMLGSSCIFADQVTSELYQIIANIAKIVINTQQNRREGAVKKFMREVALLEGHFKFFSFSFSTHFKLDLTTSEKNRLYEKLGLIIMRVLQQKF